MADDFVSRKCCHCGTVAEYPLPADFKLAVPKYLDGKPFEDGNFSLKRTVMRCPKCGYVSFDVSRSILRDSNIVSSNEYESIIKSDLFPKYIANYIAIGYIYERQNEYYHASHAYLCAAWGCRDEKREKEAEILLEKAAKLILKHIGSNEFKAHPDLNMLQCAVDILRQIREFENAKKLAAYALSKNLPEDMKKIFLLEQSLCDNYISAPHAYKPENETKIASFADLFNRFAEAKTGDDKMKLQAFADAFEFVNSVKYKEVAKGVSLVYNPFFNQGLDFVRAVNLVRDVLSDEKETHKTAEKQVVPENEPAERPAPIKVLTKAEDLADKPQSAPAREEPLKEEPVPEVIHEKEEIIEVQAAAPVILTQTALENERKEAEPEITEELASEEDVVEEVKPVVLQLREEEIRPVKVLTTVEDLKEPEPEEEQIEEEVESSDEVAKEELAEEVINREESPEESESIAESEEMKDVEEKSVEEESATSETQDELVEDKPEESAPEEVEETSEISVEEQSTENIEETFENDYDQTPEEVAEEAAEESLPEMNVSPEDGETEPEISEEIENEDLPEEEIIADESTNETAETEDLPEEEQLPADELAIELADEEAKVEDFKEETEEPLAETDAELSESLTEDVAETNESHEEEYVEDELESSDEVAKEELAEEIIDREESPEEPETVDEPEAEEKVETEESVEEESETSETQDELVEDEPEESAPEEVVPETLEEEPEQTVEEEVCEAVEETSEVEEIAEEEPTESDGLTENVADHSEESPSATEEASELPETEPATDEEKQSEPENTTNTSNEEKHPDLEEENMAGIEDDAFASTYEEQCETITTLASIDGSISVSEVQSLFEYGFVKAKGILDKMATDGLLERTDDPETFRYVK